MIVTREDIVVLLHGIFKHIENCWGFVDLTEEELAAEYESLNRFDSDDDVRYGIIEFLKDAKDTYEDISWSIDMVLDYMLANIPNYEEWSRKVRDSWENPTHISLKAEANEFFSGLFLVPDEEIEFSSSNGLLSIFIYWSEPTHPYSADGHPFCQVLFGSKEIFLQEGSEDEDSWENLLNTAKNFIANYDFSNS